MIVKEITVEELRNWMDEDRDMALIDVREPHEVEIATIGGELIPLGTVPANLDKFPKDKPVIFYCRSGRRSSDAIEYVQEITRQKNLYNLKGGILQWADKIDATIKKY